MLEISHVEVTSHLVAVWILQRLDKEERERERERADLVPFLTSGELDIEKTLRILCNSWHAIRRSFRAFPVDAHTWKFTQNQNHLANQFC